MISGCTLASSRSCSVLPECLSVVRPGVHRAGGKQHLDPRLAQKHSCASRRGWSVYCSLQSAVSTLPMAVLQSDNTATVLDSKLTQNECFLLRCPLLNIKNALIPNPKVRPRLIQTDKVKVQGLASGDTTCRLLWIKLGSSMTWLGLATQPYNLHPSFLKVA